MAYDNIGIIFHMVSLQMAFIHKSYINLFFDVFEDWVTMTSQKTPWIKHQSQEGWVGRSGSRWLFSSGRCSRLGIPLEMEHGLRLRCCLPFQCWLQRADKARNFWMETLGLVTWWTRKETPAKCDSLSIAWVLLDDFSLICPVLPKVFELRL